MIGSSGTVTTTGVAGPLGLSTDGILYPSGGLVMWAVSEPVGDDGGWEITGTGVFPTTQGILVEVVVPTHGSPGFVLKPCFSGKQTEGVWCTSADGITLKFVVPPLPIYPPRSDTPTPFNPFDVKLTLEDGSLTYTAVAILSVIHRTYTTNLYSVRSQFPPPRNVGPHDPDAEEYDG